MEGGESLEIFIIFLYLNIIYQKLFWNSLYLPAFNKNDNLYNVRFLFQSSRAWFRNKVFYLFVYH